MTHFNAQILNSETEYKLQFSTNNYNKYKLLEAAARLCITLSDSDLARIQTLTEIISDMTCRIGCTVPDDSASLRTNTLEEQQK